MRACWEERDWLFLDELDEIILTSSYFIETSAATRIYWLATNAADL